jgi:16S rRNA (cytidine1402-2'-O)-methyltransferase
MVFYEAPHKLLNTLEDMAGVFGADRPISLCRELTKLHEEVIRTTLAGAVDKYAAEDPRGEFVLIVGGATPTEAVAATPEDAAEIARAYLREGMSPSEAAKQAAADTGLKKGEIYRLLIAKED